MNQESNNRARLGIFVLAATTCLVLGLYYMGSKKNIFHRTITVSTQFTNVDGLMSGNNVRFNGINVGTVNKVYAVADTIIKVEFTIDEDETKFIGKSAIASIGTDGLLGNKLINILPGEESTPAVTEGSILASRQLLQKDNAFRTLVKTNDNLEIITDNLKNMSEKINTNNSLWKLLADTVLAQNMKNAMVQFKITGNNTATLTGDLSAIVKDIKKGKGLIGSLLTDTSFSHKMTQTIVNINTLSDTMALVSGDFRQLSAKFKNNKSPLGTLLTDTTFVHNLNSSMENIKTASGGFNDNMEALKHTWPLKKYFQKLEKMRAKKNAKS